MFRPLVGEKDTQRADRRPVHSRDFRRW
jgi:hypothetical protein